METMKMRHKLAEEYLKHNKHGAIRFSETYKGSYVNYEIELLGADLGMINGGRFKFTSNDKDKVIRDLERFLLLR